MFAVGIQNWFDHDWVIFGVFCWNMPRFVDLISAWTKICKKWSIIVFLWWHHKLVENNIGWKTLALQCNFLFYLFVSSGLALPKVSMKCLLDYFWTPISPFSKFCVNCLLRLFFAYCNNCVLNDVHRVC